MPRQAFNLQSCRFLLLVDQATLVHGGCCPGCPFWRHRPRSPRHCRIQVGIWAILSMNRQIFLADFPCRSIAQVARADLPCRFVVQFCRAGFSCRFLVRSSRADFSCRLLVQTSRVQILSCRFVVQASRADFSCRATAQTL